MKWIKAVFLIGLLSILFVDVTPDAMAADSRRSGRCRSGDRLFIEDLDMSPDPIAPGERIRAWKVRLRFDGKRQCDTDIFIREVKGKDIVGNVRDYRLEPGVNEINLRTPADVNLNAREYCFVVLADLEGARQQVDASRQFCARPKTVWSMREPEDRGRFQK
jgi:hypothetical protein